VSCLPREWVRGWAQTATRRICRWRSEHGCRGRGTPSRRTQEIDRTVLVFRRGERELAERIVSCELGCATVELVEGADTRHGSELNVLRYLAARIESGDVDVVLIHDAARPLAGPELMRTALATAREFGGEVPAVPAGDVVSADADGHISTAGDGHPDAGARPPRRSARDRY